MISKINIEGACRSMDEQARYVFMDERIKNKSFCCRCNKQEYEEELNRKKLDFQEFREIIINFDTNLYGSNVIIKTKIFNILINAKNYLAETDIICYKAWAILIKIGNIKFETYYEFLYGTMKGY